MLNKNKHLIFLLLLLLMTVGCSKGTSNIEQPNIDQEKIDTVYYTFTDALNKEVILEKKPERVISLVGSYAETWTLAGGDLVGITDDVEKENRITITDDMKIVGTIKEPNVEEVLSAKPDFVLLSTDVENQLKLAEILEKTNIPHAYFKVEEFEDYLSMLDICTDITGKKDLYEANGIAIQKEIEDILSRINVEETEKPKVLFFRAFSSGAKAKKDDNMTCTMLKNLGAVNIAAEHPSLLEDLSIEEIIEEDPDFIFVTTMGSEQKALDALKEGIEANPAWSNLKAIKNDNYILLPKDLFHYKPNVKWGESYGYLAKYIYPEIFEY